MKFLIAFRLEGEERELLYIAVSRKGDFYAYLKYSPKRLGLSPLDLHMSYHKDGYRQLSIRGKVIDPKSEGRTKLQKTSGFRGVELLLGGLILKGQLPIFQPLRKTKLEIVLLDADSAGFRDDMTFVRVFLVEPGKMHEVPPGVNPGPRLIHTLRNSNPWIVVDIFQEKLPK